MTTVIDGNNVLCADHVLFAASVDVVNARFAGDRFGLDLSTVLLSRLCSPRAALNICYHTL
jgi:hypothetical protein